MRFQVPQFIEVEDKIFGPLTFKQFVYVAGGGGIIAIFFFTLPTFLAVILAVPVGVFAGALAFYQVNKRPFVIFVESILRYALSSKLYTWKKEGSDTVTDELNEFKVSHTGSEGGLKELNWSVDVEKEGTTPKQKKERE